MKIKYMGNRPALSICCTGRVTYFFGPENGFTQEITNPVHAGQILSSTQHKFEALLETPKEVKEEPIVLKEESKQEVKEKISKAPNKKRGRKHA